MNHRHRLVSDRFNERERPRARRVAERSDRTRRLAIQAALIAAACVAPPAGATTFFTGSGSSAFVFSSWDIPSGTFGFVYEYYDTSTVCGTTCMAVTSASGASLGTASFGVGGNYYFSNVGNGEPATLVAPSVYVEKLLPFGGGSGNLSMSLLSGGTLLNAAITGFSVYATPGMSDPVIEYDLTTPSSTVLGALPTTLYLDVTGTTTAPLSLSPFSGNPSGQIINGFTIDWTSTLTDTPYSPTASTSIPGVPEPSSFGLLAAGLGAMGWAVRRRRR